jgi:hypothetical protein
MRLNDGTYGGQTAEVCHSKIKLRATKEGMDGNNGTLISIHNSPETGAFNFSRSQIKLNDNQHKREGLP